jgi:hypothetical protein
MQRASALRLDAPTSSHSRASTAAKRATRIAASDHIFQAPMLAARARARDATYPLAPRRPSAVSRRILLTMLRIRRTRARLPVQIRTNPYEATAGDGSPRSSSVGCSHARDRGNREQDQPQVLTQ